MRSLGLALVFVSLVFGAGGVAVVGRADDGQQSVAPTQSVAPDVAVRKKALPQECAVPAPRLTKSPKLYKSARRATLPKDAVPLNTRGYNYGGAELPQMPPDVARPPAAPAK